jgi:hypothetical protein
MTTEIDARGAGRVVVPDQRRAPMATSVVLSMLGKAAEMVTLLLLATVVPRALGPADYGRFSVPLTIVTVGSLALTLGGPMTLARFVPAEAPQRRVALARRLGARLAWGRAVQLAAIALVSVVLVVVDGERFPPLVTTLVVAGLTLNVVATLALQVTLGLGRTAPWIARYPLQNVALIAGVLLLHSAGGATGAVAAIVVAGAVAATLGIGAVLPVVRQRTPRVELPQGAIRFGAIQAAGAALVQFTHRGGVLAVAVLHGADVESGYAALAIGIALGVTYAVVQAFTVTLPHLARRDAAGDAPDADARGAGAPASPALAEATSRRLAGLLLAAVLPAAAVLAAARHDVVAAVFGSRFRDSADAFGPAFAMVVLAPLNALALQAAALRLRPQAALANAVAGALAFIAVAVVAIADHGAQGATLAMLAGSVASAATAMFVLPGAAGPRLAAASFGGAAVVLALGVLV